MEFKRIISIVLLNSFVFGNYFTEELNQAYRAISGFPQTNEISDKDETPYWLGALPAFEDVTCKPWNTCLKDTDCGRNSTCEFKYDDYYNGFYELEGQELLFIMKRLGALAKLRIERRSCKGVSFLCHVSEVECFLNGESELVTLDHQWCIKNSEIDRKEKGLLSESLGRKIVSFAQTILKVLLGIPLAIFGLM